jgi:hypothetical protein
MQVFETFLEPAIEFLLLNSQICCNEYLEVLLIKFLFKENVSYQ